eukprot:XP_003725561.2 PREDICTED: LOW QUALITY PROTEIN: plancitoxin-1 [Strongylocentrotus purpuratus]
MAVKKHVIGILFFSLTSLCLISCELSCKDPNGNNVDWFIVQKLPWNHTSSNPLIHDGVAHLYMDVHSSSFSLSDVSLNDSNQAVGYTLQQIYKNYESQNVLYMMYNDAFPNGTKEDDGHTKEFPNGTKKHTYVGHTKGTVAFDNESGFWLVHSVPKFPNVAKNRYVWPSNARNFGQSMLCISMKTDEFVKVGKQLLYNYASAYDWNIPPSFRSKFSDFVKVSKSEHIKEPPWNNTVLLTTLAGQSFTSFAKSTNFHEDLYWYLVAPSLEDDLYVETWMRNHKLRSFCNGSYHVENVLFMRFPNVPGQGTETVDHSKWAIGKNKKWVCIGDINRTESQYKRGGGTVCGLLATPWEQYTSAIRKVDKCPPKRVFGNRT